MDNEYKNYKADRVLKLLFRALKGESLSVAALADESNVSTRSITRDINDLKAFLADYRDILGNAELKYSASDHCYTLEIAFSSMYGDIVRHEMLGLLPGSTSIS